MTLLEEEVAEEAESSVIPPPPTRPLLLVRRRGGGAFLWWLPAVGISANGAEAFMKGAPPAQGRAPIGAEKAAWGTGGGGSGIIQAPGPGMNCSGARRMMAC